MSTDLDSLKHDVAIAHRVLSVAGLASGALASLGHVSMRVPGESDKFVVKGRGLTFDVLGAVRDEDMVVCDLNGFLVEGPKGATQPNEVMIHCSILRARPDVMSVVHVHPRYTVVLSTLGHTMRPVAREGMLLVREPLPVYPNVALVTTQEEGMELANVLGARQAALLFGHGAVTVGTDLEDAVMNMVNLEEQAKMNWYAYCAAGPDHARIPEEMIKAERNKPRFDDLPHMKDLVQQAGVVHARGAWQSYAHLAQRD
jgi:ribulose-5-phosphate 4-epimerase/fuculose-1-phosphate aldolase